VNKTLKDTRKLVILSLMLAITMILDFTPLGAIPMGTVEATITHIPTIITGIILGPVAGLIMGLAFGLISFFHALIRPVSPFSLFFINPIISILPRMFIGVAAYYAYALALKLFKAKLAPLAIGVGAFVGSLTNTILVLGALSLIYGSKIEAMLLEAGLSTKAYLWALGVAGTNGLMEGIVSVVIVTAICSVYFKQYKS